MTNYSNMVKKYKYLRPIYPIKFQSKNPHFKPVSFESGIKLSSDKLITSD